MVAMPHMNMVILKSSDVTSGFLSAQIKPEMMNGKETVPPTVIIAC